MKIFSLLFGTLRALLLYLLILLRDKGKDRKTLTWE